MNLYEVVIGSGPRQVVFLHGLFGQGKNFSSVATALADVVGAHSWAFITAWNPQARRRSSEENLAAQRDLLSALQALPQGVFKMARVCSLARSLACGRVNLMAGDETETKIATEIVVGLEQERNENDHGTE